MPRCLPRRWIFVTLYINCKMDDATAALLSEWGFADYIPKFQEQGVNVDCLRMKKVILGISSLWPKLKFRRNSWLKSHQEQDSIATAVADISMESIFGFNTNFLNEGPTTSSKIHNWTSYYRSGRTLMLCE